MLDEPQEDGRAWAWAWVLMLALAAVAFGVVCGSMIGRNIPPVERRDVDKNAAYDSLMQSGVCGGDTVPTMTGMIEIAPSPAQPPDVYEILYQCGGKGHYGYYWSPDQYDAAQ